MMVKEQILLLEGVADKFAEVGGYGDHVAPYTAPPDTPGEWIYDPWGQAGNTPIGPGISS